MVWHTNRFRRHLLDMHIEDWNDEFLSRFDPQTYVDNLIRAKINTPMIYFQSHVGYCYFPTRCARIHKAFEREPGRMRRLVDLCHANGMAVVGYYSLIYNTWAHDAHPQWRMVQHNGKSKRENDIYRYGLCCPNNMDYRAFVFEQIREMMEYFTVEGMFYDMLFWPHVCYCESCKKRWADEVGGEIPESPGDERWEMLLARRRAWMGEFAQVVTDKTRELCPGVTVEHNFSSAASPNAERSVGDEINDACDYTGGDLYGGFLEQSFTCKYYMNASRNQPFEYMTGRCDPNLSKHTITKSRDELTKAVMLTCAHHGATLLIDAIDPVGTMDSRVYDLIGEVFEHEIPYEPFLRGELVADVGVMYHLPSKVIRYKRGFSNHDCALQSVRTMIRRHTPVGVITSRRIDTLSQYPAVIAPYLHDLTAQETDELIRYVEEGGCLYLSGAEEPALIERLLGAHCEGYTEHTVTYLAPGEEHEALFEGFNAAYPLPFDTSAPILAGVSRENVLATVTVPYTTRSERRFASIHSDPPGVATDIPAVVRRRLGKGQVIWSALPIEKESIAVYRRILVNLLSQAGLRSSVQSDAPPSVELVTFRDGNTLRVSAVDLSQEESAVALAPFTVSIRTERNIRSVALLPDGSPIPFEQDGGFLSFRTRQLSRFDMYEIKEET